MKTYSKTKSLLIIAIIYAISIAVAFVVYHFTRFIGTLWAVFIADAAATVIVWAAGIVLRNPSVYDPYWSVAPMIIIPLWMAMDSERVTLKDALLLGAVAVWGMRLTYNWISGWRGLSHVDWRYDMLKEKNPKMWFITNFFGINMMPTVFVYIAMIPAYFLIQSESGVSPFMLVGFIVCVTSATLQLISDTQMKRHRKLSTGEPIDTGLWRYSRHPNYFGEIMFWWGIFIMTLGLPSAPFARITGAIFMTGLFVFISIPMMERHVEQKLPEYSEYKRRVSMLILWKRKE